MCVCVEKRECVSVYRVSVSWWRRGNDVGCLCCNSGIHPFFENNFIRLSPVSDLTNVCVYEQFGRDFTTVDAVMLGLVYVDGGH